jgi:hypothetical protein
LKKISLRNLLVLLIFAAALSHETARAAAYRLGGRWLLEGDGFAEKSILRVSLNTNGRLAIKSDIADGSESLTGYDVYGELNASRLDINTWSYQNECKLSPAIEVGSFNPTMSNPFRLPPFTVDKLTYAVTLTSVNSGTVNISGYVDIDTVGRTAINADCAIWREGTPKPAIPDTGSGCDMGTGALGLLALSAIFLGRRNCKR